MMDLDTIYNEDCLATMNRMPDNFIDLTVTSPPYDNLREYKGYSFNFECIALELYRITKQGGVLVWVVNDATVNGSETGTSFRQALFFKECGFNLHDTMIWRKTNPMPQVKQPRYGACFEYMFVLSKGKPKTFNPIMRQTKFGGRVYNSTAKNMGGESGRHELNYTINTEGVEYNIWDIAVAQNKTSHPAVFPIAIPRKHIFTWTNKGDVVYDPFIGSGTTASASINLNRHFVGSEISQEYYDIALNRIREEQSEQRLF